MKKSTLNHQLLRWGLLAELVNVDLKWAKPVSKASVFGVHLARLFKDDPADTLAINRVWQSAEAHTNVRPFLFTGKGSPGTEFLDSRHLYAADLDIFGVGSLFELVNAARTQIGRTTLAAWLLEPASPHEIVERQGAIKELSPKVDLRERLGFLAAEIQTWIPTDSLSSWARQPRFVVLKFRRNNCASAADTIAAPRVGCIGV